MEGGDQRRDALALRRRGVRPASVGRAAHVEGSIGERHRGAVVEHVAEHHRRDDDEDERPLPVPGDPLQRVQHAVVEEDGDAAEHQEPEHVLDELVDCAERGRRVEDEEIEPGREPPPPQHEDAKEEEDEPREDELMGQPRRLVIIHLFLHERIPPHPLGSDLRNAIETVLGEGALSSRSCHRLWADHANIAVKPTMRQSIANGFMGGFRCFRGVCCRAECAECGNSSGAWQARRVEANLASKVERELVPIGRIARRQG